MSGRRTLAATFAALLLLPRAAASQAAARPEVRVDAVTGAPAALHAGAGVNVPVGTYVRLGFVGAAGVARAAGEVQPSGRADVLVRFALDPFGQTNVGLSAGGGVSARWDEGRTGRLLLVLALDAELHRRRGAVPFVQVGLGGGARVGAGVRWRRGTYR